MRRVATWYQNWLDAPFGTSEEHLIGSLGDAERLWQELEAEECHRDPCGGDSKVESPGLPTAEIYAPTAGAPLEDIGLSTKEKEAAAAAVATEPTPEEASEWGLCPKCIPELRAYAAAKKTGDPVAIETAYQRALLCEMSCDYPEGELIEDTEVCPGCEQLFQEYVAKLRVAAGARIEALLAAAAGDESKAGEWAIVATEAEAAAEKLARELTAKDCLWFPCPTELTPEEAHDWGLCPRCLPELLAYTAAKKTGDPAAIEAAYHRALLCEVNCDFPEGEFLDDMEVCPGCEQLFQEYLTKVRVAAGARIEARDAAAAGDEGKVGEWGIVAIEAEAAAEELARELTAQGCVSFPCEQPHLVTVFPFNQEGGVFDPLRVPDIFGLAGPGEPPPDGGGGGGGGSAADLRVTKTGPASVQSGQDFSYQVTVANEGPAAAAGVNVIDVLPGGTLIAAPGCTGGPGEGLTCAVGDLAAGDSRSFTITVRVDSTVPTQFINQAYVTSATPDPNPANDKAEVTTDVTPEPPPPPPPPTESGADLQLAKAAAATVAQGADLTYTLTVTNAGPDAATGVRVTDRLPAGVTFRSASSGCTNQSGTVTCTVGGLAAGGSATRTITVRVGATTTGTITNEATVTGTSTDPSGGNNSASATTTVEVPPPPPPVCPPSSGTFGASAGNCGCGTMTVQGSDIFFSGGGCDVRCHVVNDAITCEGNATIGSIGGHTCNAACATNPNRVDLSCTRPGASCTQRYPL
jgi:uncharacterized repeat protein (TIGR01451 family)